MSEEFMKSVGSYLPMIVIVVAMILIMIIPQRKRDKKMREMLESVKAGDNIKTIGGVYGKVVSVKEDLVTIETGPEKAKIVFAKGAIATVESAEIEGDQLIENK